MKVPFFNICLSVVAAAFAAAGPIAANRADNPKEAGGIILGGFDVPTASELQTRVRVLDRAIAESRNLAPAALQSRIRWSAIERREGQFDWAGCDRIVASLKENGLRWSPILTIGGINGAPAWMEKKTGYRSLKCVDHGLLVPIASPWRPQLRESASRFLKAFCERYRDSGLLESVSLGISGLDGRASLPESPSTPNSGIHVHSGLWNGDSEAERSFQIWLAAKYAGSGPLRDAWGGLTQGIPYVKAFLKRDASTERAWIDQMDWLADSVAAWSGAFLKIVRAELPRTPVFLRTTAHGSPESGCDLALQSRAAAESGAGIQVTLKAADYRTALSQSALAAATTAEYKIPLRTEIEGALSGPAVTTAVYTSAATGARSVVLDSASLARAPAARTALQASRSFLNSRARLIEIGVFYPETSAKLLNADIIAALQPLRDRFDFDLVRESQVTPEKLSRYRALIMLQGNVGEGRAWRDLHFWTRKGGLLLYPEGMGRITTVERDDLYHFLLFAPRPEGKDILRSVSIPHRGNSLQYREKVMTYLMSAPELSQATKAALRLDSDEDGIYAVGREPNRLWLNMTTQPKTRGAMELPPFSITAESGPKPSKG